MLLPIYIIKIEMVHNRIEIVNEWHEELETGAALEITTATN